MAYDVRNLKSMKKRFKKYFLLTLLETKIIGKMGSEK